jgi:hypothetical protein
MSSRNCLGQFEKGVSGNPKGRPRKEPRRISDEKLREDFFDAAEPLSQLWKAESVSLSPRTKRLCYNWYARPHQEI